MASIRESKKQKAAEISVCWYYVFLGKDSIMQSTVGTEHFVAMPMLGIVWERAMVAVRADQDIDVLTVTAGIDGALELLSDHTGTVAVRARIEQAETVMRNGAAVHRAVVAVTTWLSAASDEASDASELYDQFGEIAAAFQVGEEISGEWHGALVKQAVERFLETDNERVIPMPILASRYRGYKFKKFYLIGGITSNHKTTFALQSVLMAAKAGHPALYWTLEDDNVDVSERLTVSQTEIMTLDHFERGRDRTDTARLFTELMHAVEDASKLPLLHLDKKMTLTRTLATITRLVYKHKIKMVVIDFIQLILRDDPKLDDTAHQTNVSQALADLAKRLNIVVIGVVQLTQAATIRSEDGEAPRKGDIRGGSAISQSCYGLVMMHRPENAKRSADGELMFELWIRKWKRGPRGKVQCWVSGEHDRFREA